MRAKELPRKRCVLIKKVIFQYGDCISIVMEVNFLVISLRDQSELMYSIMGQKEERVYVMMTVTMSQRVKEVTKIKVSSDIYMVCFD